MAARDVAKVISFQAKRRGKPTGKPTGKPQSDHHHTKLQGADGVRDGHCKLPVIYEPMGKAADTAAGPHIVEGATGGVFSIAARAPDDDCNKSSAAAVTIESAEQAQRGGCGGTKKQPLPPKKQKTTATGASHGQTSAGCRARGDSTPAASPSSRLRQSGLRKLPNPFRLRAQLSVLSVVQDRARKAQWCRQAR